MTPVDRRATAHVDLEESICNVSDMGNVCRVLVELFQAELRTVDKEKFSAATCIELLEAAAAPLVFCVLHLHDMAHELRNEYYAPLDKAS